MSNNVTEHLVRRFVLANSLSPLTKDEAVVVRPWRPSTTPADSFTGRASIVFKDHDGLYRGGGLLSYSNLNPALLFKNITPTVYLYNPQDHAEIVDELGRRYGVPLFGAWVVNQPFDYTKLPQTVTVEFAPNDFINQVFLDIRVERASASIDEIFQNDVLESPKIPFTPMDARANVEFSYREDFTPDTLQEFKFLKSYPLALVDSETLYANQGIGVLSALIEQRMGWHPHYEVTAGLSPTDLCFRGSQAIYNGSTKRFVNPVVDPASPTADAWYDNVLVIRFDPVFSGVQGLGYFHYNELS